MTTKDSIEVNGLVVFKPENFYKFCQELLEAGFDQQSTLKEVIAQKYVEKNG